MTNYNPNQISKPAQDSADNNYIQDVLGNKLDTHSGDSLYGRIKQIGEHFHSESKVYPTLADGVTVTGAAGVWTLGNFVEIVPASTIASDFDIHYISIEDLSGNDVYELVLYKGALASEVEIGRRRLTKNANLDGTQNQPFQTPLVSANERISAKVATKAGGSKTATISIGYHTY